MPIHAEARLATACLFFVWFLASPLAADQPSRLQEEKIVIAPKGEAGASIERFVTTRGERAMNQALGAVGWDDDGLKVMFDCEDEQIVFRDRKRDDPDAWQDDSFELFIDPGHTHDDQSKWIHLLVTAGGAVLDEKGPMGARYGGDTSYDAKGLAVKVDKTIRGWRVHLTIPWADLGRDKPPLGEAWGINFCREDYPHQGEYTAWSPTYGPFARIARWGHVIFSDPGSVDDKARILAAKAVIADQHNRLKGYGMDATLLRYFADKGVTESAPPPRRAPAINGLLAMTVTPAAAGTQMVRLSVPMPEGLLRDGGDMSVSAGGEPVAVSVRALTWYPVAKGAAPSARRAMVTFPYTFKNLEPVQFVLQPAEKAPGRPGGFPAVTVDGDTVNIGYRDGRRFTAKLIAPACENPGTPESQVVESNQVFEWRRVRTDDPAWSRVIETRVDALGTVTVVAHLQQSANTQSQFEAATRTFDIPFLTAPDFGWQIETADASCVLAEGSTLTEVKDRAERSFAQGLIVSLVLDGKYRVYHPAAPFKLRGKIEVRHGPDKGVAYRYLRSTATEKVPMQSTSWRRAEFVIAPVDQAPLTATLEYPHESRVDWRLWDALYRTGRPLEMAKLPNDLSGMVRFHYEAIIAAGMRGDDWGNHGCYDPAKPHRVSHGMNRLNHGPAIFFEGWRSGDRRLVNTAVAWCENFHDLSIWWGPEFWGGTRYPQANKKPPTDIPSDFMWRSDEGAADFCTKGFDSFFLAYEQTGDPLMLQALGAQAQFAKRYIHTGRKWQPVDTGHPRNIGTVIDFVRLYRYTGQPQHLEQALRLFRELRDTKALQPNNLFTEAGFEPVNDDKFIPHDGRVGETYIKPYILGYALEGLPALLEYAPDEPRLRDTVQAVSDFLAKVQDPVGSWRYPHPLSPNMLVYQAPEHAMQIANADRAIGAKDDHLDTIERMLRLRLHYWLKTGRLMVGLGNWESAGPNPPQDLWSLYNKAAERDSRRDWAEGAIEDKSAAPNDGLVYVPELVQFYLEHRPASRLLEAPKQGTPLATLLSRVPLRQKVGKE
ncbi:MAG: hypothetical protein K8S99_15475 [Planctomycetes bacterium]|nr:hypothetical protein [Planctomycetota bacterium]